MNLLSIKLSTITQFYIVKLCFLTKIYPIVLRPCVAYVACLVYFSLKK